MKEKKYAFDEKDLPVEVVEDSLKNHILSLIEPLSLDLKRLELDLKLVVSKLDSIKEFVRGYQ